MQFLFLITDNKLQNHCFRWKTINFKQIMHLDNYSKMITLILSTFGCMVLTPFIILTVAFLAILAVFTSTITSSFIFLRLALMTIKMISGVTIESTNWLLSTCLAYIKEFLAHKSNQKRPLPASLEQNSVKRKLPPLSISLSRLPYKAQVKSKYSVSVPGTPSSELYRNQKII